MDNSGHLPSRSYYGSPHQKDKSLNYLKWVEGLRDLGILEPYKSEDLERKGVDWIRFKPGELIRDQINKEKAHREEMASMRDLLASEERIDSKKADRTALEVTEKKLAETDAELKSTREELAKTNQVVRKIALAVRKLQTAKEPPITPDKLEAQRQAELELGEHTSSLVN